MAQTLARLRKTSKGASPGHRDAGVMIQLGPHTFQSLGGGADGQALIVDSTSPTGFSLGMPATTPVVIPDEVVTTTNATIAADAAGAPGTGEKFLFNTDTGVITHFASGGAWVAMPALAPDDDEVVTTTTATLAADSAATPTADQNFLFNTDTGEFTHYSDGSAWVPMPANLQADEVVETTTATLAADSAGTPGAGENFLLNTDTGEITHYASGGAWVAMPAIPDEIIETDNANVAADSAAAAPAGSNFLFNTDTGAITHFNDGGTWAAFPVVTIPNEIIVVDNTTSAAVIGAAAPAGSKLVYNRQADRATHWNNGGTWTVIPATPDRQDTRGSLNPAGGVIALPTVGGAETTVNQGEAWDIGDRYLITAAGTVGGITVGADDLPAALVFNGTGNGTADSHWTLFSGATVIGDTLEMGWNPPTLTPDAAGAIANGADAGTVNGDLASWLEALNDKIDAVRYVDNFVPVDINHNGAGSIDITAALAAALMTAGYDAAAVPLAVATLTSQGVKTAAPDNIVRLIDRASNRGIISALDNTVYGRITEAAGVYTVTYYSINPDTGAEVPAIEGGSDPYRLWIPYRFTDDSVPRAAGTNANEVDTFAGTDLGFLLGAVNQAAADSIMVPTNHAVRIGVGGNLEGAWLNVGAVPAAATAANLADPTLFAQIVVNRWREIGDATTTLAGAEYTVEGLTGPLTISNHTIGLNESVLITDQPRGLLTATNKIDLDWGGTLSLLGGQTLTSPFELDITGMTIEIINRGGGDWLGILYGSGNGAGLSFDRSSYVAGTDASGQTATMVAGHNLIEFDISSLADGVAGTPVYSLTLDTPPTDEHTVTVKMLSGSNSSEVKFVRVNLPGGLDGDAGPQFVDLQLDTDAVTFAPNVAGDGYDIISSHLPRVASTGGVTLPITLADVSDSGTAAALDVPATAGTAATAAQVVRGDDPRLDLYDASFTPLIITGDAPTAGTIPAQVTALSGDEAENEDRAWGRFDDFDVFYQHDGTNWTETGRALRVQYDDPLDEASDNAPTGNAVAHWTWELVADHRCYITNPEWGYVAGADNTAAFAACAAQCSRVIIPDDTLVLLASQYSIPFNGSLDVEGHNKNTSIVRALAGSTAFPLFANSFQRRLSIKGLTLDGNSPNTTASATGYGVQVFLSNAELRDLNIIGTHQRAITVSGDLANGVPYVIIDGVEADQEIGFGVNSTGDVRNSTVRGADQSGFAFGGTDNCQYTLHNLTAENNGIHGISLVNATRDCMISQCRTNNNGTSGLVIGGPGTFGGHKRFQVIGHVSHSNTQLGLAIDMVATGVTDSFDSEGSVVVGGEFYGNSNAGVNVNGSDNIEFRGTMCTGNTGYGLTVANSKSVEVNGGRFLSNGSGSIGLFNTSIASNDLSLNRPVVDVIPVVSFLAPATDIRYSMADEQRFADPAPTLATGHFVGAQNWNAVDGWRTWDGSAWV